MFHCPSLLYFPQTILQFPNRTITEQAVVHLLFYFPMHSWLKIRGALSLCRSSYRVHVLSVSTILTVVELDTFLFYRRIFVHIQKCTNISKRAYYQDFFIFFNIEQNYRLYEFNPFLWNFCHFRDVEGPNNIQNILLFILNLILMGWSLT